MRTWQLQQAKQRFSEVVRRALEDGPQIVTRHGREAVVVVSVEQFAKLGGAPLLDTNTLAELRKPRARPWPDGLGEA